MTPSPAKSNGKKRTHKSEASTGDNSKKIKTEESNKGRVEAATGSYRAPTELPEIQNRINKLLEMVPSYEETVVLKPTELEPLETWCRKVRSIIRQFNLVLNFVKPATYQWGPDRSGHNDQNLGALNKEVSSASSSLSFLSRDVNSILTPALDKQLRKCVKTTEGNVKTVMYTYESVVDDPEMLKLSRQQLCDEAVDKRELMIVVMQRMEESLADYLKASANNERMSMTY